MEKIFNLVIAIRFHVVCLYMGAYFVVSKRLNGFVPLENFKVGALLFFLVQFIYIHNKVCDYREDLLNSENIVFTKKNRLKARNISLLSMLAPAFYAAIQYPSVLPIFIYGILVFFAYSEPRFRLKKLFLVKSIIVTIFFFLVAVLAPVLLKYPNAYGNIGMIFASSISLILIVFCLTVLFDIRDIKGDLQKGVKTIPVVFGLPGTVIFLCLLMGIAAYFDFKKGDFYIFANDLVLTLFILGSLKVSHKLYYVAIVIVEIAFLGFMFM